MSRLYLQLLPTFDLGQHPASDRYKPEVFRAFFVESLASGGALTIRECQTGRVIGSSRFHGYNAHLNEIEIGWTFFGALTLGRYIQR